MSRRKNPSYEKIRAAIMQGSLTRDEMERRLIKAIETEYAKAEEPANVELINACEDLLWELGTNGKHPFVTHRQQYLQAVRSSVKHKNLSPKLVAGIAATVVLLLAGLLGDSILHQRWLVGGSTTDEQQYVVKGKEIDPGLISSVDAAGSGDTSTFASKDLKSLIEFLGFEPDLPQWFPEGLENTYYSAVKSDGQIQVDTTFTLTSNASINYILYQFVDAEDAHAMLEQNKEGDSIFIGDKKVYFSKNLDRLVFSWMDGLTLYTLTGEYPYEDMKHIIDSIGGSI